MVHSIGRFTNGCFAGGNFGKFVDEIFEKSRQEPNEGRENKNPDRKGCASIITDSLLSERKQLGSDHLKPDFIQNAKVSVTRSRRK